MKRKLAIFLAAVMLLQCFPIQAFAAATYTTVRSLYFTIDTSSILPGTSPDEFDKNNVPVECVNLTAYPGLNVTVTDLQCISDKTSFKVGDSAKVKFWIDISGYDTSTALPYYLTGSTSVHVSLASGSEGPKVKSVSKARSGSYEMAVTVTTNTIKGQYTEPRDLEWKSGSLGQAYWQAPEDENCSGYYDIKLLRDGRTVYTQKSYNATSLNLYPWMTKEGDYTFSVRCVVTSSGNGAKSSEWVESDGQEVTKEKVSDGSGQGSSTGGTSGGNVGWKQVNGKWYFYYPDGTQKRNGWEKISNKWYLFDANGMMLTGWQTKDNNTYYLDATNGDMKTGWVNTSDGQWYYLNPNPQAGTEGAMLKNTFLDYKNYRYYLNSSGAMSTGWTKINQNQYYFRPTESGGAPKGSMVMNQRVDGFWLGSDGKWVQGQ